MKKGIGILMFFVVFTMALSTFAAVEDALRDEVLLYLPYDTGTGNVTEDMSGNGYHGELFIQGRNTNEYAKWQQPESDEHWIPGRFGNALAFYNARFTRQDTGANMVRACMDTHIIGYADKLLCDVNELNTEDFSISFWVRRPIGYDAWVGIVNPDGPFTEKMSSSWGNIFELQDAAFLWNCQDPNEATVDWWYWGGESGNETPGSGLKYNLCMVRYANDLFGPGPQYLGNGLKMIHSAGGSTENFLFEDNSVPSVDTVLGDGEWHHVVINVDGDPTLPTNRFTTSLYIDDMLIPRTQVSGDGWGSINIEAITIGIPDRLAGNTVPHDDIDDYAVWTRLLTADERAYLAANPLMPTVIPNPPGVNPNDNEADLVAWYHFEEGTGMDTMDLSLTTPYEDAMPVNGPAVVYDSGEFNPLFFPGAEIGNVFESTDPDADPITSDGTYYAVPDPNTGDPLDFKLSGPALGTAFTISAWIKPVDMHSTAWGVIATVGGYDGSYIFYMENGKLVGIVSTETTPVYRGDTPGDGQNPGPIVPGQWNHVAMVWDQSIENQSEFRFYLNGAELTNNGGIFGTSGSLIYLPGFPFTISAAGKTGDNPTRAFRGRIDDVRVYSKALTQDEILGLRSRWCVPRLLGDFAVPSDCSVDLVDFAELGAGWSTMYDINDLANMAYYWLGVDLVFPTY